MSLTRLRNKVGTTLVVHNAGSVNMHNFEEKNERTDFGTEPGSPKFRLLASQLHLLARGSRQGGQVQYRYRLQVLFWGRRRRKAARTMGRCHGHGQALEPGARSQSCRRNPLQTHKRGSARPAET